MRVLFSHASWAHPTSVDTDVIVTDPKKGHAGNIGLALWRLTQRSITNIPQFIFIFG